MREPRNPFRLRRSESIDTETSFLTLFEPGILEIVPNTGFWETVHILRSAAGGGKTSLIRLFTPNTLLTLCARRTDDRVRNFISALRTLGQSMTAAHKHLGLCSCAALATLCFKTWRLTRLERTDCSSVY